MVAVAKDGRVVRKKENELKRIREQNSLLKAALEFYADPYSYKDISIVGLIPCGIFLQDFSDDHGDKLFKRPMPGKRARLTLGRTK